MQASGTTAMGTATEIIRTATTQMHSPTIQRNGRTPMATAWATTATGLLAMEPNGLMMTATATATIRTARMETSSPTIPCDGRIRTVTAMPIKKATMPS